MHLKQHTKLDLVFYMLEPNDGMIHGFRVSDGKEVLAYVPNQSFHQLIH